MIRPHRKDVFPLNLLGVSIFLIMFTNCSLVKHQVFGSAGNFMMTSMNSLYQEDDLQLAERFFSSNLKLIELLAIQEPNNRALNLVAGQAFGAYAMAFVDDYDPERATRLYQRGLNYALRALPPAHQFDQTITPVDLEKKLKNFKVKDVPALFWIGYNWGSAILHNLDQPEYIADLAKVEMIMHRVLELDEKYNFGGVHLFYANYYAARPPFLGGNPAKGKEHFECSLALTANRFNLTKYYYARYYAVQVQDLGLFDSLLTEIINTDLDQYPEIRLFNAIARQKALLLYQERENLFDIESQSELPLKEE